MIERGQGFPLVLVPGIQGHWQWMAPAIDALARRHRVVSYSLGAESEDHRVFAHDASGRASERSELDVVFERAGIDRAIVVGISFGGLIAAQHAARRPERVAALVIASSPSPRWDRDLRVMAHKNRRRPPVARFVFRGAANLLREIRHTLPWYRRAPFVAEFGAKALVWRLSPRRIVGWLDEWMSLDLAEACRGIEAPALVITGEPALDHVVPTTSTQEYVEIIPGATHATLAGTGHIGTVSKAGEFARLVTTFTQPYAH